NLLVSAVDGRITGVVDWERASPADLPHHDLFHLLVYARMSATRCEVGDVVASILGGGAWDDEEQAIIDVAMAADGGVGGQAVAPLLLFWLRHVSLTLTQEPHRAKDWVWMTRNVERVLIVVRAL
ncbi:MAG: aminoglycoside phosphotransferase family protein, partial [Actinobacteria bacterium]|nr:aminoglycoside phosphotransferase family protein [Actinomycetota bacterium]